MSEVEHVDDLLRATELFGSLDDDDRRACARAFRKVQFEAGRLMFHAGDEGDRAYLIAEGLVRLTLATAGGRELNVRMAGPREMIGEIAVLDRGPRSADAIAVTDVTAFSITTADLDALFDGRKGVARSVIHLLCRRLRATTVQLEGIALHRIEVRLARFLLTQIGDRTAAPGKRVPLELGYSQSELARLIGSSRPKLNGALGVLEKIGAVKRTADRLFCDPEALAKIIDEVGD